MEPKYTTDEIRAIIDGEPANDAPVEEVGRYYFDEIDQEEKFRPYTMDEINAMLDRAEADIAMGRGIPDEEVWREFENDLLHTMIEKSEEQLVSGKWQDSETMMRNLRKKYSLIMNEKKHLL